MADAFAPYCCRGCRAVHGILTKAGLTRYYDLRRGPGLPPADLETRRIDHKWLELIEEERATEDSVRRVELDIQGIHCAACVWLIEELFRRHGGARMGVMSINPALGRVDLRISPDFALADWVDSVEDLGYLLGPAIATGARPSDDLLLRVGICAALAGNVMLFAAAIYLGLREGPIYELLNQLSYAAGVLAVLIGGSVFIGSALRAIRKRVLHLDVPIALGIVLAFAGSTYSFFFASGHAAYIDTLTVFVALMLAGRWLQQRMLERNRAQLLADDGTESLLTREVKDGVVRIVHCIGVAKGDRLLIAPGDLVPVELRVLDRSMARAGRGASKAGMPCLPGRSTSARKLSPASRTPTSPPPLWWGCSAATRPPEATAPWPRGGGLSSHDTTSSASSLSPPLASATGGGELESRSEPSR
jgi:Cu2+-exporting ATPase